MSSGFRVVQSIRMKRNHIHLLKRSGGKYGHWWFELGDPSDPDSESYGWWPEHEPTLDETLGGLRGELNGPTNFEGTLTQDPYHAKTAQEEFHPWVATSDSRTDEQIADCLRQFARSFVGEWRWEFGLGTNCHTFQEEAMSHCGLLKQVPQN